MELNEGDYSQVQLKEWLKRLGLKTSGTKAELIVRLNELRPEERGEAPFTDTASGDAGVNNEGELQKREIEILRREKELLLRENNLLKQMSQLAVEQSMVGVSPVACVNEQVVPLNMIKDMVPEFTGETSAEIWINQVRTVGTAYSLNENLMRVIIVNKIAGKAQTWLHGNVGFASLSVDQLLGHIQEYFGTKENKLIVRRKFEARLWKTGEKFVDYYNEKTALASSLQLDEDELLDYLLEGVPDENLRTQAYMQRFSTRADLLRAFSKVELKFHARQVQQGESKVSVRCYNCSSLGHMAYECKKPKRAYNTCFGCGSKEHKVVECPERKKPVSLVESNEYVKQLNFVIAINYTNLNLCLETLFDTGSPISFVQKSYLPFDYKINKDLTSFSNVHFFGLNKSKLRIIGTVLVVVFVNNLQTSIELKVVADGTTSYAVVLGRDFLTKSGSKLIVGYHCDRQKQVDVENCDNLKENEIKNNSNINNDLKTSRYIDDKNNDYNDLMAIDINDDLEHTFVIGEAACHDVRKKFIKMFNESYVCPFRPRVPQLKCEMKIILNDIKPFNYPPRRISYFERLELQKLIDEYLAEGFIQVSESEYASPIVLVKKKSGGLRMCVDFRKLNKATVKDNYPLPLIDDLLDRMNKKKIFSKLDLKNGFYHVYMHPESVKLTSFVTPLGQYEFLRMPFGLKNAPSMFQRFVNKVFADMIREGKIIIYMDDIMIATENITDHMIVLEEVFQKMVENKLELRLDKCEFFQKQIKYLGYMISEQGIKADAKGLQAIQDFPIPDKVNSLQSFLGLCSYFRRFVKDFSILARPLYDLTKKSADFKFGPLELKSFELLKNKLLKSPILAIYDPNHETELHCDASSLGFGAILLQKKEDSKFHPVFYFSKKTTEAETKYHSFELETLAIIYALKRFRIYLLGKKFKIVTDCNSLTLTLNKKEINPRIARWALELQDYDYTLEHRKSQQMQHVDALSRCIMVIGTNTLEDTLIICQGRDENIRKLQKFLEKAESKFYEMRNGVVYRKTDKGKILFYVPEIMETQIIFKFHDDMGHIGVDKVVELISKSYWFPKLKSKVVDHVRNCLKCIVFSSKPGREEGLLHIIPKGKKPFDVIHIDHYGPIDISLKTYKYILVIVDACTKFVRLYCTKTTKTREAINALSDYFRAYSRPKMIISDRGSCFTSVEFKNFLNENNVNHLKVATGSPQANGQVERINRSLGPMISKLICNEKKNWTSVVEIVEFSLNNTFHRAIGQHPSVMLFGVNQRGKVTDILQEELLTTNQNRKRTELKKIRAKAAEKQLKLQIYNKKYVDKKRKIPHVYNIGDYAMIKNFDSHTCVSKKLIPKFKGPYKVIKILRNDRYLLKDVDGFQQSQIPYKGVWAVGNMRPWINERFNKTRTNKEKKKKKNA